MHVLAYTSAKVPTSQRGGDGPSQGVTARILGRAAARHQLQAGALHLRGRHACATAAQILTAAVALAAAQLRSHAAPKPKPAAPTSRCGRRQSPCARPYYERLCGRPPQRHRLLLWRCAAAARRLALVRGSLSPNTGGSARPARASAHCAGSRAAEPCLQPQCRTRCAPTRRTLRRRACAAHARRCLLLQRGWRRRCVARWRARRAANTATAHA